MIVHVEVLELKRDDQNISSLEQLAEIASNNCAAKNVTSRKSGCKTLSSFFCTRTPLYHTGSLILCTAARILDVQIVFVGAYLVIISTVLLLWKPRLYVSSDH